MTRTNYYDREIIFLHIAFWCFYKLLLYDEPWWTTKKNKRMKYCYEKPRASTLKNINANWIRWKFVVKLTDSPQRASEKKKWNTMKIFRIKNKVIKFFNKNRESKAQALKMPKLLCSRETFRSLRCTTFKINKTESDCTAKILSQWDHVMMVVPLCSYSIVF